MALFQDSKPITDTNEGSITEKLDEVITSDLLQTMRDFRQKLSAGDAELSRETDKEAGQMQDVKTPGYLSVEEFSEKVSGRTADISKEIPEEDDRAMDAQSLFARDFGFNEEEFLRESPKALRDMRDNIEEVRNEEYRDLYIQFTDHKFTGGGDPNCYAFASGWKVHPITGKPFEEKPQPGEISGYPGITWEELEFGEPDAVREKLVELIQADYKRTGKELIEVDVNYVPQEGERKIALVHGGGDYHFYYEGTYKNWYHKEGVLTPSRHDSSGHRITDPQTCDRGMYRYFDGYFVIRDKEGA